MRTTKYARKRPEPRQEAAPRRAEIEIDGERLGYALYECDVRSDEQRQHDAARGALAEDLIIIIPGHGQTADSALRLIHTSAQHSQSKVAWCVDSDMLRSAWAICAQRKRGVKYK